MSPTVIQQALPSVPTQLSFDGLRDAAQSLQKAYRDGGYGAVVVLVPEQTVTQGVVRLDVIEGKLRQVQVTGNHIFSRDNILRSLPALQIGQTPRLSTLDSELLMANENPAKSVRVIFQPGEKRSDVEALAVVEEQQPRPWQMIFDNTGNDSTGQYRLAANYQNPNVADRDLVLGLRASTSPTHPSQVAVLSGTLRVPFYAQKTFLEGSVLVSNTSSANNITPAGDLRFSGRGTAVGVRAVWTLPSLGELKSQASAGLDARRYRNDCSVDGLGSEACGTAAASVDVLPLSLTYSAQKLGHMYASAQWVINLPAGGAGRDANFEASRPGASSHYQLLRLNVNAQHSLTPIWQLNWQAEAQLAGNPLVPAEQFGAGGVNSVRGYDERALNADSGLTASLALLTPLSTLIGGAQTSSTPKLSVFADISTVKNRLGTACTVGQDQCTLWGAGVGLSLRPTANTSLKFEAARAGKTINDTRAGDWRLHLSLNYWL